VLRLILVEETKRHIGWQQDLVKKKGVESMHCINHEEAAAAGTCVGCGKFFCKSCMSEVRGKYHCSKCIEEKLAEQEKKIENLSDRATFTKSHVAMTERSASPGSIDPDEVAVRNIANLEKTSAILWLVVGIIQICTLYLAIAGIWNILGAVASFKQVKRILQRDAAIPNEFLGVTGLIIIGLVNLFLGGVVGVVLIGLDFYIRSLVLKNSHLFTLSVEAGSSVPSGGALVSPDERCNACGARILEGASFCRSCGNRLNSAVPA
jgi:hypothetical protein